MSAVKKALGRQAAVALTGPRQVGKTTLAHDIAESTSSIYLDLEDSSDRLKLADPGVVSETGMRTGLWCWMRSIVCRNFSLHCEG